MREYTEESVKKLQIVKCNACGKEINIHNDIITEGVFSIDYEWNYFSQKDGETHSFDLCEECYNKVINNFIIPVDIEKRTELM